VSRERPTFGSLFAGIGGIDLGLERAGWECRFQVEWDAYCQRVLAKHWPDVPRYGDITAVDWSGVERVDLLAGGFPCQPVSNVGRRRAQADERWLWPEFARAISVLRPSYVLVENVPGLLVLGLGDVLADLDTLGYHTERDCLFAADVGAPHLRERLYLLAHTDARDASGVIGERDDSTVGQEPTAGPAGLLRGARGYRLRSRQSRLVGIPDGVPVGLDGHRWPAPPGHGPDLGPQHEWEPPRVLPGRIPNRVPRVKALGNAVVPQVVEVIGRQLLEAMTP
jgi:DNA (cytosine-5)-methyltransferase 1